MVEESNEAGRSDWFEASGLKHIVRTLGFAVHPAKMGLALAAVVLTFLLGSALDLIWTGNNGVDATAVARFISAQQIGQSYEETTGDHGIFEVWWKHERRCITGFLAAIVPGVSAPSEALSRALPPNMPRNSLLGYTCASVYGVMWLFSHHLFYFVLFGAGTLFIWALAGGGICRIASVQFASGEKLTFGQGLRFARDNLFGGFVLAPCVPVILAVVAMVLLALGGMVLRIPVLGDLLGGLAFVLALLGGFVVACLLLGSIAGGSLFWPAIAAEGQDAYDSFSRGLSYAFSKPWKAILYAAIAICFAALCWIIVQLFVSVSLGVTHQVVAFGTSPFGWWSRGGADAAVSKLDLIWTYPAPGGLYAWPSWGDLSVFEHVSGFLIGVWVLLIAALTWAFLASFYFSGSTIVYFLLRRDVDGTDLGDVHVADEDDAGTPLGDDSLATPSSPVGTAPVAAQEESKATTPIAGPPDPSDSTEKRPDNDSSESDSSQPDPPGS